MKVLGLSAYYHDATAAVIVDGRVAATAAEERLTLQKHDQSYPKLAIDACLQTAGIAVEDLDAVVFYEEPHLKFPRVVASCLAGFPRSVGTFTRAMKTWLGSKLWIRNEISKRLGVDPSLVHCVNHHKSHAAQAFAASPYRDAAILIVDAVGEWASTSLWRGRFGADGALALDHLLEIPYPHSLGLVYAAFTAFLGFKVNDGECSTMALAAFGQPRYVEQIRKIIVAQADGTYVVDNSYFEFDRMSGAPFARKFLGVFGTPRDFRSPLPFDSLANVDPQHRQAPISKDHQRWVDIAASLQVVLEETLLNLCRHLHRRTGVDNLCLAGGVALNCVANSRLLADGPFANVFVPPDPGDGGAAVGAGLYGYYAGLGQPASGFVLHPYLGCEYDATKDLESFATARPQSWSRHREPGASAVTADQRLEITTHDDFDRVIAETVADLQRGRIVGWYQGRFENGPRALGNRSILIDPANIPLARKLSATTKKRAGYRPYALSIAAADAHRALHRRHDVRLERWMQLTQPIQSAVAPRVAAALHVNGTTRPQVCGPDDNSRYHRLLTAYGSASGFSALLNTSFNMSGLPIVSTPTEALLMFARTDMDTLVLGNTVIRKRV
jgi:carbamoyltransferase